MATSESKDSFLALLGAPARRALTHAGLTTAKKLSARTEQEVLALHGMGPASMPALRKALKTAGLSFRTGTKAAPKAAKATKSAKAAKPAKATKSKPATKPKNAMKMYNIAASNAQEYRAAVAAFGDWRSALVASLRKAVVAAAPLEETLKWGHLVYVSNGPVLLIRTEDERVLFGFWRGQRLRHIEPRLVPGGKYEMATMQLRAGDRAPSAATVKKLVREAVGLNAG